MRVKVTKEKMRMELEQNKVPCFSSFVSQNHPFAHSDFFQCFQQSMLVEEIEEDIWDIFGEEIEEEDIWDIWI